MKKPILAALALCYALGAAAQTPDTAAPEGYRFTDVKILPVTPVKDQSRSGTCWCYSTLSFLESEILRAGGPELDLISRPADVRRVFPIPKKWDSLPKRSSRYFPTSWPWIARATAS